MRRRHHAQMRRFIYIRPSTRCTSRKYLMPYLGQGSTTWPDPWPRDHHDKREFMFRVIAVTATLAIIAAAEAFGVGVESASAVASTPNPTSQQLVAEAAKGNVKAHLFGLSPQSISTIPAEQAEASALKHG